MRHRWGNAVNNFEISLPWQALALLAGVFFVCGLLAMLLWVRGRQVRSGRLAQAYGKKQEEAARKWLNRHGFKILKEQPRLSYDLLLDSLPHSFSVQPDYLAEKAGEVFVVEVKSSGATCSEAVVRRQLLEYLLAGGYAVILLNMPSGDFEVLEWDKASSPEHAVQLPDKLWEN